MSLDHSVWFHRPVRVDQVSAARGSEITGPFVTVTGSENCCPSGPSCTAGPAGTVPGSSTSVFDGAASCTLTPEEKPRAAPPVLEFDAAGNIWMVGSTSSLDFPTMILFLARSICTT